jgi:hypothetical protein
MKRIFILLIVALLATSAFAEQASLIDFSLLVPDTTVGDSEEVNEHQATLVDFADAAGASFTGQERDLLQTSLAIDNWEVDLNSSARFVRNVANSHVRLAQTRESDQVDADLSNVSVLGVRVMFPTEPHNAWAFIRPPFEIPAYADPPDVPDFSAQANDDGALVGFGVVKNVGVVKQLQVRAYGLNFPHSLSAVFQDENGRNEEVFFGNLQYDGWRSLVWENPNYIEDVRDRALRETPLYPNLSPLRKLIGFRIYRDASHVGGDFVMYLKDVQVIYDRARLQLESDIDHEELWNILTDREEGRRRIELRRLGEEQILRALERQKQSPEDESFIGTDDQGDAQD